MAVIVFLIPAAARAQMVKDWRVVRSAHFEMVSRYEPARMVPLLRDLEWARAVFEARFELPQGPEGLLLILIPDNPHDYEQLAPVQYSAGHYMSAPGGEAIVMRDLLLEPRHVLLHEYAHLILHREGGHQWPLWFSEGTAEYYATMQPARDGGVVIGAPGDNRIQSIRTGAWIPVAYLVSLSDLSELPSEQFISRFYAQTWLYMHMLHLAPAYKDRFGEFRTLIAQGTPTAEAIKRVYSRSLVQFDGDARYWLRQQVFPVENLEISPLPAAEPGIEVITDNEASEFRRSVAALTVTP